MPQMFELCYNESPFNVLVLFSVIIRPVALVGQLALEVAPQFSRFNTHL